MPGFRRRPAWINALALVATLTMVGAAGAGGGQNGNPNGNSNGSSGWQPPLNTAPPTITGSAVTGSMLTASPGSWSGRGLSLSYLWQRCDPSGNGCSSLAGSTATSYAVVAADLGSTLKVAVSASNKAGSASALSAATAVVIGTSSSTGTTVPPANVTPPAVSGVAAVGQTLAATGGSWSGSSPMNYAYQWKTCATDGGSCAPIADAVSSSYTIATTNGGATLRVEVTAQNAAGLSVAASPATAPVATLAGTPQPAFPITAAFYYPWYPETWTVNGAHVFYHPSLGYYTSTDVSTQQAHIRALQYAGMKASISSWWGPGHYSDTRLKQLMQTTIGMGSPLKWAVYYENEGYGNPTVAQLAADLAYIRDSLATSSAYLKVGGKFVVFVYNADDTTCDVATRWKQANDQLGDPAYIDLKVFMGYRNCASQPSSWHQYGPNAPADDQPGYSYSIAPGFWRADAQSPLLARDPVRWKSNVAALAASADPWKLVTTFNEWTEGTAVESAGEWSSTSGYGTYLDALHAALGGT
jgi:hypothetical protein